ncbi:GntR family transcriptional regulator [Pikeienuella piscinae]|uniref:GntR family transcriptional regulator n=1 Tax=Pikeienuella piscinae TaxID=2748098 RepID=A0A7L5BZ88_9RHOB|nr:GntR family transcriptional regulator [Pikeienuella piscinae]QIE56791.1 GntR family transcriptional regulator [Pikeienuella piscinae]
MTLAQPLPRVSLHDQIVEHLREAIVAGELQPGEKLNEKALCARFAVSRTPLREAIKVLSNEGLVRLTPHYGASVAPLTLADLDEVFPIMGALEALAGELACARIEDEEIDAIARLHQEMLGHYEKRDLRPYFECNQKIHDAILVAARNPTLAATLRGLAGRVRRARYFANMSEERWAEAVEEHGRILETLRARDAGVLGPLLRAHLGAKLETVRVALRRSEQRASSKQAGAPVSGAAGS